MTCEWHVYLIIFVRLHNAKNTYYSIKHLGYITEKNRQKTLIIFPMRTSQPIEKTG